MDGLLKYCLRLCRNRADAEDVAQSALCRAWEKLEQLVDSQKAKNWLFSIARNIFLASLLRRREELEFAEAADLALPCPQEEAALRETGREVLAALAELSECQRQAIIYCAYLGYSPKEFAEMLGIKRHAANARLNRARSALRKKFGSIY